RAMEVEIIASGLRKGPGSQRLKNLVSFTEIRLTVTNLTPELHKDRSDAIADFVDDGLDGITSQVSAPGDARAFEIALKRPRKSRASFIDRKRRSVVRAGHHRKQQRDILNRAGHRAFHGERVPSQRHGMRRDAPRRRSKTDDVAEAGRISEQAPKIAAVRKGQHPTSDR